MRTIVLTVLTLFMSTIFYSQQGDMSISMEKFPIEGISLDSESLLTGEGLSYDYFLKIQNADLTATHSYEVDIHTFDGVQILKTFVVSEIDVDPDVNMEGTSLLVWMGTFEALEILDYHLTVTDGSNAVVFSKIEMHVVE